MNYQETLKQAGLTAAQAEVYETLLKYGEQGAGLLTKKTSLKRGLVYKVLEDLIGFGLAEKTEKTGEVARFIAKHPAHLRELVSQRQKELKDAELVLDGLMPSLVSEFNLISGHPGVSVYEGDEAMERVMGDSVTSHTDIYSYVDPESIDKYFGAINKKFLRARKEQFINKHLLVVDSPTIRSRYTKEKYAFTEVRVIPKAPEQFPVALQIYDKKISYLVLLPERIIGVIIEDPYIYALQKFLFEQLYEKSESIFSSVPQKSLGVSQIPDTTPLPLTVGDNE